MGATFTENEARRAAIRRIVRSRRVATQEEPRELLDREGFEVTQATLSRDLARLQARRVSLPEGGTTYEVPMSGDGKTPRPVLGIDALARLRGMVTAVAPSDALVIVHTLQGMASAVALAIDSAQLPEVAGTIAGDDTIFIAPSRGVAPGRIARQLTAMWIQSRARPRAREA
jgi:transcriptional regulator of arginine metabolism